MRTHEQQTERFQTGPGLCIRFSSGRFRRRMRLRSAVVRLCRHLRTLPYHQLESVPMGKNWIYLSWGLRPGTTSAWLANLPIRNESSQWHQSAKAMLARGSRPMTQRNMGSYPRSHLLTTVNEPSSRLSRTCFMDMCNIPKPRVWDLTDNLAKAIRVGS